MLIKAKHVTHTYPQWREQLSPMQRMVINTIVRKQKQQGCALDKDFDPKSPLEGYANLVILLTTILDEGGETLEYVRDLAPGE